MPDRVIGPLRDAREPLFQGLRLVRQAAAAVQTGPAEAHASLDAAIGYLRDGFLAQSRAEEFTLYTAIDGVLGCVGATDVMAVQHGAIGEMVEDLEKVAAAAREGGSAAPYAGLLLALLHGLFAAIRTHLEAEDAVYLAVLDEHLSESQVRVIVDNLGRVASGTAAPG